MIRGLEYSHPTECHVGKCSEPATVNVALQLTDYRVPVGDGTIACAAHVAEAAALILAGLTEQLRATAAELERVPEGAA